MTRTSKPWRAFLLDRFLWLLALLHKDRTRHLSASHPAWPTHLWDRGQA